MKKKSEKTGLNFLKKDAPLLQAMNVNRAEWLAVPNFSLEVLGSIPARSPFVLIMRCWGRPVACARSDSLQREQLLSRLMRDKALVLYWTLVTGAIITSCAQSVLIPTSDSRGSTNELAQQLLSSYCVTRSVSSQLSFYICLHRCQFGFPFCFKFVHLILWFSFGFSFSFFPSFLVSFLSCLIFTGFISFFICFLFNT